MRRRIQALLMSAVLAVGTLSSGGMREVSASETTKFYGYEEVKVLNPASNLWHVTEGTTGDGGADWAFDDNSATHWHTNYSDDVKDDDGKMIKPFQRLHCLLFPRKEKI